MVEFGAVRFRLDGTQLGCFEQLADPGCPIPWVAQRVHKISDAMVRGQPIAAEVLPHFFRFLGGPETILLAHNGRFDLGFLATEMAPLRLPSPEHAVIDTLDLARRCLHGYGSRRLENLAIRMGIAPSEEHRALSDSLLVVGLFLRIVAREPSLQTVGDLLRLSPPLRFHAPIEPPIRDRVECEKIEIAIRERRTIVIVYDGGSKGLGSRRVTPRAILRSGSHPYLAAFCHADRIEKTYRIDRIRELKVE